MTAEELKRIIANPEGTEIEYKKSQTDLARSVYESISAFLNRKGGHVILGAENDGTIIGIDHDKVQQQMDTLAKDMNNPQLMNPPFYLNFEPLDIDGKKIIYFYVPESGQAHSYKGVYYDRNRDGDFSLKTNQQIADLMLRKQAGCSENRVFPYLTIDDFETVLFDDIRKRIELYKPGHLWTTLSNHELLKSAGMWLRDPLTGKEGYTLAAAMLFGTESTIHSVAPFYRIDALCRIYNTDLYDNRDIINCNLLRSLDRLTTFCERNLPEWPYIEGLQRMSLRDVIFREVCLNLIIHSEYGARHSSTFTIWGDRVEITNWNIPYGFGQVTLDNFHPYAKNPVIANFFAQLGIVEEVGKGTRTMFKYVPLISGGQNPVIEEMDEFKVIIPYLMAGPAAKTSQNGVKGGVKGGVKQLTDRQRLILNLLEENGTLNAVDLAQKTRSGQRTIQRDLAELQKANIITREGGRKDGRWIVNG